MNKLNTIQNSKVNGGATAGRIRRRPLPKPTKGAVIIAKPGPVIV